MDAETKTALALVARRTGYLREADLREADLREADLSGADLSEANLSEADLREADLSRANLRGANLSEADLSRANLSEANLSEADLRGANLRGANLSEADLSEADLREADLSGVNLREADLSEADGVPLSIPKVHGLYRRLLDAINAEGQKLDMGNWHTCKTTHCRAGWTVVLAGEDGRKLETAVGTGTAAALIHAANGYPRIPNWYADTDSARAEIEAWAKKETADGP